MSTGTAPERALPRRQVLADEVYEAIKAMLMDHVITPGDRISIDGLARELEVSPTPVRESLARLESEGLAVKLPLKGYRATPLLSLAEFDDLYRFRQLLEPWAAGRAAERRSEADLAELEEELATAVPPDSADYEGYKLLTAHDARFHAMIARMSGSNQVHRAFERTHCHLHIFRLHFERRIGIDTVAEHEAIVEAIRRGDADAAADAMERHLHEAMVTRLRLVYRPDDDQEDTA